MRSILDSVASNFVVLYAVPAALELSQPGSEQACDPTPPDSSGAKLFVIFFLTLIPLLGIAIMALVIYSLWMR